MALSPGTQLGRYEILAPAGKGGMGEVYRARDTRLGRVVAIKVLAAELANDSARRARFEREARAASSLSHPNIASLYDIGRERNVDFIVSEFIDGESLRTVVSRGRIELPKLLEIASQIAAGLKAAHAAGIVHRDLKPENIMLTSDGRAKILDFGLAKQISQVAETRVATPDTQSIDSWTAAMTQPTTPGVVMGTIGYMSPEQVRGQPVDLRSDIFSFGAVLYEMAAGKRPFGEGSTIEVLSSILRDQPPKIEIPIPAALDRLVRRCLEKSPERRFQSCGELALALDRAKAGASQAATHRPWRMAAAGGVCIVVAAAVWIGVAERNKTPARPQREIASKAQQPLQNEPTAAVPSAPRPAVPRPAKPERPRDTVKRTEATQKSTASPKLETKPATTEVGIAVLDPATVDSGARSLSASTRAPMNFVNRSSTAVDIYWIDYKGNRVLYHSQLPVGASWQNFSFVTHLWLVVASGTGGTKEHNTGIRIAAFEALTAAGGDAVITDREIAKSTTAAQKSTASVPRTQPEPAPGLSAERMRPIAEELAKALSEGRYEDVTRNASDNLKPGLKDLGKVWEDNRKRLGKLVWVSTPLPLPNVEFVWFEFERGTIDVKFWFAPDGQFGGFYHWFYYFSHAPDAAAATPDPFKAQQLLDQAVPLSGQGKHEEALRLFNEAIQNDPNLEPAYQARCVNYVWMKQYHNALWDCTHAIHLNNDPRAVRWRGDAAAFLNLWDDALAAFDESIRLMPTNANFYGLRAWADQHFKQFDQCVEITTRGLKVDPKYPYLFQQRAFCYEQLQKYDLAVHDFDEYMKLGNSKSPDDFNRRGSLYNQAKQYDRAIADFNEAIRLKPDFKNAYNNRGFAKDMLGDSAGAAADRKYARELP